MSMSEQYCLDNVKANLDAMNCHGLTKQDFVTIESLISNVKDNDKSNQTVFPDFISDEGFIEHFRVTSGIAGSNGYKNMKDLKKADRTLDDEAHSLANSLAGRKGIVAASKMVNVGRTGDSLENLHASLKQAFQNHIQSLELYKGAKHISCFMIESDDALFVRPQARTLWNNGNTSLLLGDLEAYKRVKYCLAYDADMLDYLYSFKDEIDYVIFVKSMNMGVEIIKVENIPYLKEIVPFDTLKIYPVIMGNMISESVIHLGW